MRSVTKIGFECIVVMYYCVSLLKLFSPHILFSSSFCAEKIIHVRWLKSVGWHPLIWVPFKSQIKHSQQGVLLEKLASAQEKQPSILLFISFENLNLNRIIFICRKCRFVIPCKASFYQHSGLKWPNYPLQATAFQRAHLTLPCIKNFLHYLTTHVFSIINLWKI